MTLPEVVRRSTHTQSHAGQEAVEGAHLRAQEDTVCVKKRMCFIFCYAHSCSPVQLEDAGGNGAGSAQCGLAMVISAPNRPYTAEPGFRDSSGGATAHLHMGASSVQLDPDAGVPGLLVVCVPRRHHHDAVPPPRQCLWQRPHHVAQPACDNSSAKKSQNCLHGFRWVQNLECHDCLHSCSGAANAASAFSEQLACSSSGIPLRASLPATIDRAQGAP